MVDSSYLLITASAFGVPDAEIDYSVLISRWSGNNADYLK